MDTPLTEIRHGHQKRPPGGHGGEPEGELRSRTELGFQLVDCMLRGVPYPVATEPRYGTVVALAGRPE